jgi:hypothetical protein
MRLRIFTHTPNKSGSVQCRPSSLNIFNTKRHLKAKNNTGRNPLSIRPKVIFHSDSLIAQKCFGRRAWNLFLMSARVRERPDKWVGGCAQAGRFSLCACVIGKRRLRRQRDELHKDGANKFGRLSNSVSADGSNVVGESERPMSAGGAATRLHAPAAPGRWSTAGNWAPLLKRFQACAQRTLWRSAWCALRPAHSLSVEAAITPHPRNIPVNQREIAFFNFYFVGGRINCHAKQSWSGTGLTWWICISQVSQVCFSSKIRRSGKV